MQGATAWLLLRKNAHLEPCESVAVHAAAGGVGSIAVQLAKAWGAGNVVATASSAEKRELALELGADAAVDSTAEDMTTALREANGGRIAALAPFGRLAFYGMASREQPRRSSCGICSGTARRSPGCGFRTRIPCRATFTAARCGSCSISRWPGRSARLPGGEYGLSEARKAHEALRSRGTVGKLLLDPRR